MAQRNRLRFVAGIFVILTAVVWLALSGFRGSRSYYYTIEEIEEGVTTAAGERIRVGGVVAEGSIEWTGEGLHFRLTQGERVLPVAYRGDAPVPDTFKGGSNAVIEGVFGGDGTFEASRIQAKCASKYEAKYAGTKTMDKTGNR